jgi:hypothetical protein
MQAMYRSRRFGRLLAAWLLLWFVLMSAAPVGPLLTAAASHSPESVASDSEDAADCGSDHDHIGHAAQALDGFTTSQVDAHAGHGANSLSHCPLCLHCGAPPAAAVAVLAADDATAERPPPALGSVRRTRTDVPPPARGPPALS